MTLTLEEYFKREFAVGAIDFSLRAHAHGGVVEIYIHPSGRDGTTTPPLIVEGNRVRPKFGYGALTEGRYRELQRQGVDLHVYHKGQDVTTLCIHADDTPGHEHALLYQLNADGRRYLDPDTDQPACVVVSTDITICEP